MPSLPCPCGTGLLYDACCGVFHAGAEPPDAERLMRSRYSAFVRKDVPYLFRTLHPDHEDKAQGKAAFELQMKRHFAERIAYRKLEVLDTAQAEGTHMARVLFVAHVSKKGKDLSFAEVSNFAHDGVGLRYHSGRTLPVSELGRNRERAKIALL